MPQKFSMDDYVDVAERIVKFYERYPEGSLQTVKYHTLIIDGKTYVVYQAAAYRTADDVRPAHGLAWEPVPGKTPYTRESEMMNAETAAWGRAIVALGIMASAKIASKQEVMARKAEQDQGATDDDATKDPAIKAETLKKVRALVKEVKPNKDKMDMALAGVGAAPGTKAEALTEPQARELISLLTKE